MKAIDLLFLSQHIPFHPNLPMQAEWSKAKCCEMEMEKANQEIELTFNSFPSIVLLHSLSND